MLVLVAGGEEPDEVVVDEVMRWVCEIMISDDRATELAEPLIAWAAGAPADGALSTSLLLQRGLDDVTAITVL